MTLDVALLAELRQDVFSQDLALASALIESHLTPSRAHLSELDTHLVVRVDTPDGTLHVDLVLVQCDQGTQGTGSKLLEHDAVGRLVALEDLGLDESSVGSGGSELLSDLLLGLAECKGPVELSACLRV